MATIAAATTPPFRCYRCDAEGRTYTLEVDGAQQKRRVRLKGETQSRLVMHDHVSCSNGHEWWTRHPEALKLGRAKDKARKAKTA